MKFRSAVRRTGLVVAIAALVASAGCAKKDEGEVQTSGVKLVEKGKLTVCTHLPYPPFQSKDASGKVVGFDVDLMDLVAKELGVEQKIVDTPFEGIKSGQDLNTGKCDAAAASMTITEERQKVMDFSDPYFDATQALLVQEATGITDPGQLAGKKVGVQNSTTGQEYAQNNITGAEIVVFEDLGLLTTAVQTGTVDAAIADNGPLLDFAKKNPGLAVTAEFRTDEQYGFGVRKGNTALLQVINETIAASRADGTYDRIYEKWFGQAPSQG